jgi:hypothetical protein
MTRGFRDDDEVKPSNLIDVGAEVRRETDKAWLVFDGAREVWLPKSQCERNPDKTFTMPEWLAVEKELI